VLVVIVLVGPRPHASLGAVAAESVIRNRRDARLWLWFRKLDAS